MLRNFIFEEDGVETVEFIGMVAVAVVLILAAKGVASQLTKTASKKANDFANELDGISGGSGGSRPSGAGQNVDVPI